ncbi:MAG: deoxyribonuclease IV [Acidimicrobiales bacterium]
MRIGAHVRAGGQLVPALERGAQIGAEVVQVFTQSPRAWKPTQYGPDVLAGYRAAQAAHPTVSATYCHATYLINLATDDPALLARSRACLVANLSVARGMGASGLVLHLGSHKGSGFEGCVAQVADALVEAVETATGPVPAEAVDRAACPILVENAAGAGGTVGRSIDELAAVLDRAALGPALGICLDTQHLWASGAGFCTPDEADQVVRAVDASVGLGRLGCLHLNDSKVERGANRDRHANVGEGTIGAAGLGCFLAHPALDGLSAVLEVPGTGDGPRAEDVMVARRALAAGQRRWGRRPASGSCQPAGGGPMLAPGPVEPASEEAT